MRFALYRRRRELPIQTEFPLLEGFSPDWWHVRWTSIKPPGQHIDFRSLFSWLLHVSGRRPKAFSVLSVRDAQGKVAHVSMLFPAVWFRSDFMGENDLEISRVFTAPGSRGLGLAKYGVQECLRYASSLGGWCWYVVLPDNEASIRVAAANEFVRFGVADKRTFLGSERLGKFVSKHLKGSASH